MLRFSGKCGESTASSWSDWHGNATKKAVAATAKNGNNFEILITEFSCTLPAHSGFFQLVSWHGVVFWRLQWPGFQGRGSRAHHKNIFLFKPFTMDVWSDGAVRQIEVSVQPSVAQQTAKQRIPGGHAEHCTDVRP